MRLLFRLFAIDLPETASQRRRLEVLFEHSGWVPTRRLHPSTPPFP